MRRKKKERKRLAIIIIVIFMILLARILISRIDEHRERESRSLSFTVSDEIFKNAQSDIGDWSVYEKMQNGLLPFDGSDTDHDGLTDQEEIEIYGSDPLKMSTAGDIVPDGYKVKHGYKTTKKFSDIDFSLIEDSPDLFNVPENFLIQYIVENAYAKVEEYLYRINNRFQPSKAYKISGLHEKVEVDFTDYMEDEKEYKVIYGSLLEDDYQVTELDDGVASFIPSFENGYVALVEDAELETEEILIISLFSDWASAYGFFNRQRLHFWTYESSEFDDGSNKESELADYIAKQVGVDSVIVHHKYVPSLVYKFKKAVSEATLAKMSPYEACWAWVSVSGSQEALDCLKHFRTYDVVRKNMFGDIVSESEYDYLSHKDEKYVTGFNLTEDTFSICNFGSYLHNGGNCAGLSHITCEVYNNKMIDKVADEYSSSLYDEGDFWSYDLNQFDDEFKTFHNRGLADYKQGKVYYFYKSYNKDKQDNDFAQNSAEDEFIRFVGVELAEYCDRIGDYAWTENSCSWSSIENLKSYFNKDNPETQGNKIVMANFCLVADVSDNAIDEEGNVPQDGGHTVVVYGLEETEDPDIVELLVYDTNYSLYEREYTPEEYFRQFRIKVEKKRSTNESLDEFDFIYLQGDYCSFNLPKGYMTINLYLTDLDGEPF